MNSHKTKIIKAFENLDADALSNLLDDAKTYQDVSKNLFVERYREYFQNFIEDDEIVCDFKAFPGICNGCSKGKSGYSFVNSKGVCFAELVFIEDENDFSDIYVCNDFNSSHKVISDNYEGLVFCDDEKVGYMLTFDELLEKDFCIKAISEIQTETRLNKVLSLTFMKHWQAKYEPHYGEFNRFEKKDYSFNLLVTTALNNIQYALSYIEWSEKATSYLELFNEILSHDDEAKMIWLTAFSFDIPDVKWKISAKINHEEKYFTIGTIKVDLKYLQDFLTLQKLYQTHSYLLPYSVLKSLPLEWKSASDSDDLKGKFFWEDDDIFPF